MKKAIVFVATTPFAVNAFMRMHLIAFSSTYQITLCVNTNLYPLVDEVKETIDVCHVDFARNISPLQDIRAFFQLLHVFGRLNPSVVHSITPKAGLLAMVASLVCFVPLRFHTYTGQVWVNSKGFSRFLLKSMDRLIAICAKRVFADSKSQCDFLVAEKIIRPGEISVLGQGSIAGVDLDRFHPDESVRSKLRRQFGIQNKDPLYLFIGRIVRDKGVIDLVRACAAVNAKFPAWELWIVGPDEEMLQTDLQFISQSIGSNIRLFGPTNSPEHFMAAADILVLPSYREGFGSVVIEAAACGIPSIAYRIDGVIDAIVENLTGLFVAKGDILGLGDAMLKLGIEKSLRENLGKAAKHRAVNFFSSRVVTENWLNFYSTLFVDTVKFSNEN